MFDKIEYTDLTEPGSFPESSEQAYWDRLATNPRRIKHKRLDGRTFGEKVIDGFQGAGDELVSTATGVGRTLSYGGRRMKQLEQPTYRSTEYEMTPSRPMYRRDTRGFGEKLVDGLIGAGSGVSNLAQETAAGGRKLRQIGAEYQAYEEKHPSPLSIMNATRKQGGMTSWSLTDNIAGATSGRMVSPRNSVFNAMSRMNQPEPVRRPPPPQQMNWAGKTCKRHKRL
jgi:hypothetical protein